MKYVSVILAALMLAVSCTACSESDKQTVLNVGDSLINDTNDTISGEESSLDETMSSNKDIIISSANDTEDNLSADHLISGFRIIGQLPELPTGCEITAMTMDLVYYGLDADKYVMATQYLPTTYYYLYYDGDTPIGADLENYFIGDPTQATGYVCGTGAIVTAVNSYLRDCGSDLTAKDMTGASPQELYALVEKDIPVVVWTTIEMAERNETEGWYTEDGRYVDWSTNDHCSVLIGYTEDTITIADPLLGQVEYDKEQFESVFTSRGNKCVILE